MLQAEKGGKKTIPDETLSPLGKLFAVLEGLRKHCIHKQILNAHENICHNLSEQTCTLCV